MRPRTLRLLLIEDRADDAELILEHLREAGLDPEWDRVDDEPSYRAKLTAGFDLILADFSLPQFDALRALEILKESRLDIPFIIVSGRISDNAAVDSMRAGASDYLFKDNLSRLAAAVTRELDAADQRKAGARAREESAARLGAIIRSALDAVVSMDEHGRILGWNPQAEALFGWTEDEALGRLLADTIIPPAMRTAHAVGLARYLASGEQHVLNRRLEVTAIHRDGHEFPVEVSITPLSLAGRPSFTGFIRDITDRKRAEKTSNAHLAVSRALAEPGALDAVMRKILEAVGTNLGWEIGQVWLRDPSDGTFRCAHRWMSADSHAAEFDAESVAAQFGPGQGIVGRVWVDRRPMWLEDIARAPDKPLVEAATRSGLRSAAITPLFAGSEVNGVVEFFSHLHQPADPMLVQLLSDLSRRMGEYISRAQAQEALRQSESRFRGLFFDVAVGQALIGMPEGRVLAVNPAFCRLLGYQPEELLGKPVQIFADPEYGEAVRQAFRMLSRDLPYYALESPLVRKRGGMVWAALGLSATFEDGDHPRNLLIQAQDISKRKEAEGALESAQRELLHRARHDPLTELPNRTQLQHWIDEAMGQGQLLSMLVLNLDHFKEVNDSFGYLAGDDLLKQLGPRIQECVRRDDLVARLGGDEFGVMLIGADENAARLIASKLATALERPFTIDGHPLAVEASIGIASYPKHGTGAEILMRRADIAMHVAKRTRGTAAIYLPEYETEGASHLSLMADLRQAIQNNDLVLYYQPIVELRTGSVVGLEALLRWNHPSRGMVFPDQFIPFAEQTGVIQPLTDWVITSALRQSQAWYEAGHTLRVSVNLSIRNLLDAALPERIAEMIKALPAASQPAQRLSLEVTESLFMAEPDRAVERLTRLRRLGIRLSLDDFGTGYSSLAYLSKLPISEMKIDRSFILGIADDPNKAAIVRAALDLGHNLRLEVVAEGIEDRRSWDLLFALGCDTGQGYFMSRPMPAEAVVPWMVTSAYGQKTKSTEEAA